MIIKEWSKTKNGNLSVNNSNDAIKSPIPKIIHRVWMTFNLNKQEMKPKYKINDKILKDLHPDWYVMEWDDKKVLNFVHDYYPDFYQTYISYSHPIMRHDASRYLLLNHFGGVFIQHSFVFKKKIDPLLEDYKLVFSEILDSARLNRPDRAGDINNSIMASVPGHPFWKVLISSLVKAFDTNPGLPVVSLTGPFILTDVYKQYIADNPHLEIKALHSKYLMPFFATEINHKVIKKNCILTPANCFSFFEEAYAFSTWEGDWKDKENMAPLSLSDLDKESLRPKYDKLFVVNAESKPDKWKAIAIKLYELGFTFERFQAVDGKEVTISTQGIADVKKSNKQTLFTLKKELRYTLKCDNGVGTPLNIYLKSAKTKVLTVYNLGDICTEALIREEIIRNDYSNVVVFKDDFNPGSDNLLLNINRFIKDVAEYDITYLDRAEAGEQLIAGDDLYTSKAYMLSKTGAQKLRVGYDAKQTPTKLVTQSFSNISRQVEMQDIKINFSDDEFTEHKPITSYTAKDFPYILESLGINPEQGIENYLYAGRLSKGTKNKEIPYILHQIWTATASKSRMSNMPEKFKNIILNNYKHFDDKWQIFLWTNKIEAIPKQIATHPHVTVKLYQEEFVEIEKYVDILSKSEGLFSLLANLLRAIILQKYGGVYYDADYILCKPLEEVLNQYDFIAGRESSDHLLVGNAFIAAHPNHPIIESYFGSLIKNFHSETAAPYCLNAAHYFAWRVLSFGVGEFTINILQNLYLNNNKDGVFEPGKFIRYWDQAPQEFNEKEVCADEGIYGRDPLSGSWISDSKIITKAIESLADLYTCEKCLEVADLQITHYSDL